MPVPILNSEVKSASSRSVALDAFRGAAIALMILVNNGGDTVYPQLEHAAWNGWTLADTVFPSFLWITGVALTLALTKRLQAGASRMDLFLQVCRRSAILYALGLLVYAFPYFDGSHIRLLGVLQRIAICFFFSSIIFLTTRLRGQILWIVGLLVTYWLAMMLVPVPEYGAGNLTMEGNFAHFVDRIVLGRYNYAETATWDPEGIVSTLPALATTLFGILAGHILRRKTDLSQRVIRLFITGNLLVTAGLICSFWLPINKKIWTDSFALLMAGIDFVVFAVLVWLIDGLGKKRGIQPLVILGTNAITVYMSAELLSATLDTIRLNHMTLHESVFRTAFAPFASPANASLLFSASYVLVMWGFAYALYRRGWFLRI